MVTQCPFKPSLYHSMQNKASFRSWVYSSDKTTKYSMNLDDICTAHITNALGILKIHKQWWVEPPRFSPDQRALPVQCVYCRTWLLHYQCNIMANQKLTYLPEATDPQPVNTGSKRRESMARVRSESDL